MDNISFVNDISVEDYNMLRRSVGWFEVKPNKAQACIDNSAFIVTARSGGCAVGSARIISDMGYVAYIADVMVLPEYQGRGIGKAMMQMLMGYIETLIDDDARVYSCLMSAKGKEEFYNKFGFNTRPNDDFGAGMSQWLTKNKELIK